MPKVVGVKFRTSPRTYWFSPVDGESYEKGMKVVVETQRGVELATVVEPAHDVDDDKIVQPLKSISHIATPAELEAAEADERGKQSIIATAKERVAAHSLDMKIVDCEFTVDHSKLVLYFTAEQRVDFRDLVRDLASTFHIRIDLRQIGPRDECKLVGTLAPCGLPCCCGRFESDAEHVSIKMAKNQNLALTPSKINGMCGRLLCCLGYENCTYEDILKRAPKHGSRVTAPDGRKGTVVSVTPLTETVKVRFGDEENFEFGEFPMSDLKYERGEEKRPEERKGEERARDNNGKPEKTRQPNVKDGQGRPDGQGDGQNSGKNKWKKRRHNNKDKNKPDKQQNEKPAPKEE